MNSIKAKLTVVAEKMSNNKTLQIIQKALAFMTPVTLLGSLFSIFNGITFEPWVTFLTNTGLGTVFQWVYNCTIGYYSIMLAFVVGYSYSNANKQKKNAVASGIMSIVAFLILCPANDAASWIGTSGMFGAIVIGLLTAWVFRIFVEKNVVIKMPAGVPPMVAQAFTAVIPALVWGIVLCFVNLIFSKTSIGSFQNLIYVILRAPLTAVGANAIGELIFLLYMGLCWFFGVHGGMTVYPIMMMVFAEKQYANLAAYNAGQDLPYMFTGNNVRVTMLATVIAFLIGSKRKDVKEVAKLALLPSIFEISEPIAYGIPLILNPTFFIPYVFVNTTIGFIVTHGLQAIGFLGYAKCVEVPWVLPASIQNLLQFGWKGTLVGIICDVISILIFLPFIKLNDQILNKRDAEEVKEAQ